MYSFEFARSILFWIRGRMDFDSNRIDLELTHCFIVFPIGKYRETIPMETVSSVGLDVSYNPQFGLAAFFGIVVGGILLWLGHWIGILPALIGALLIPVGITTELNIHKSGTNIRFGVPFFERDKLKAAANLLRDEVREYGEHRSSGADRIIGAIRENH